MHTTIQLLVGTDAQQYTFINRKHVLYNSFISDLRLFLWYPIVRKSILHTFCQLLGWVLSSLLQGTLFLIYIYWNGSEQIFLSISALKISHSLSEIRSFHGRDYEVYHNDSMSSSHYHEKWEITFHFISLDICYLKSIWKQRLYI
jgi:hypothetical protein